MKKYLCLCLSIIMAVSVFAGCAPSAASSSEASTSAASSSGSGGGEKTNIRFIHPGSSQIEHDWCTEFQKKAEAEFPVTIEFMDIPGSDVINKVTVMTQSGDWPDLIAAQDVSDYVRLGLLDPIDDYLASDPDAGISKDDFQQVGLDFATVGGKTYYLPSMVIPYGLLVNTNVAQEAKVDYDNLKTWDDLLAAEKSIDGLSKKSYAFCGSNARYLFRDFYILAASNGVTYDKLADPALKKNILEIFQFYKSMQPYMIENHNSVEWGDVHRYEIDGNATFLGTGGYFAGYMSGLDPSCLSYLREISYPTGPSAEKAQSLMGALGYSIFSGGANKDLCWDLVKLAYSDDLAALIGVMNYPGKKGIPDEMLLDVARKYYPDNFEDFSDILSRWENIISKTGVSMPVIMGQSELERYYQEYFYAFMDGKITDEEFYTKLTEKFTEVTKA